MEDKHFPGLEPITKDKDGKPKEIRESASMIVNAALAGLAIIAVIVSFVNVDFTLNSFKSIGLYSLISFFVASSIYIARYDNGIYRGKRTEDFIKIKQKNESLRENVHTHGLSERLARFCKERMEKEVHDNRVAILTNAFIEYDDFVKKYAGKSKKELKALKLPTDAIQAIQAANKVTATKISTGMLMTAYMPRGHKRVAVRKGAEEVRNRDFLRSCVTRGINTILFSVIAVQSIQFDATVENFAVWAMRLYPFISACVLGERMGFQRITVTEVARMTDQNEVMEEFLEVAGNVPEPAKE